MAANFSSFLCTKCQTEIQASLDMVGQQAECPACGEKIVIPAPEADGVVRHGENDTDPDVIQAMKSRTIRIELGDL